MKIYFKTNLDLHIEDISAISDLGNMFDHIPQVGSTINLNTTSRLTLEVYNITYHSSLRIDGTPYIYCNVELHLYKVIWKDKSLRDFYNWYAPKYGQFASAYI